jgi:uncharacterized protein YodC (DUF2158 family)
MKPGDTVTLKSGGHLMTVASIDGENVSCAWSIKGDIKTKSFLASMLIEAEPPATLEQLVAASYKHGTEQPS